MNEARTTWALVVGIDVYADPAIPVLQGAVADALAACRWLRRLGVPDEQVLLHASPSDGVRRSSTPSGRAARRRPRRTSTAPSCGSSRRPAAPACSSSSAATGCTSPPAAGCSSPRSSATRGGCATTSASSSSCRVSSRCRSRASSCSWTAARTSPTRRWRDRRSGRSCMGRRRRASPPSRATAWCSAAPPPRATSRSRSVGAACSPATSSRPSIPTPRCPRPSTSTSRPGSGPSTWSRSSTST